jgi:hypothetical protein
LKPGNTGDKYQKKRDHGCTGKPHKRVTHGQKKRYVPLQPSIPRQYSCSLHVSLFRSMESMHNNPTRADKEQVSYHCPGQGRKNTKTRAGIFLVLPFQACSISVWFEISELVVQRSKMSIW